MFQSYSVKGEITLGWVKIPKKACSIIHTKTQAVLISFHVPSGIYLLLLFSHQVSNSLRPHGLQHASLPCSSLFPRLYSNSCPLGQWCHPTISSSVTPFSSQLQFFPASGSFPMSRLFTTGGQSIGASASALVLSMNIQCWFLLRMTGLISLQSKGLSRIFSNATIPMIPCKLIPETF